MNDCLADQHAIEWIAVQGRKANDVKGSLFVYRERRDTVCLPFGRNEALRR